MPYADDDIITLHVFRQIICRRHAHVYAIITRRHAYCRATRALLCRWRGYVVADADTRMLYCRCQPRDAAGAFTCAAFMLLRQRCYYASFA